LRCFLLELGLETRLVDDLVLAAGEAAGNAIEHAYLGENGSVRLHAKASGRHVVIEVRDNGRWRIGGDPERGRGLGIMKALVDRVSIESTRSGTSVRLELTV
jgi:anti-sigma regulatory factor (Ser/Thr protein kinase)